jgi:hypothetical protein
MLIPAQPNIRNILGTSVLRKIGSGLWLRRDSPSVSERAREISLVAADAKGAASRLIPVQAVVE